ncbi:MAG: hypothetical protein QM769_03055 [Pseudoxanthomonas sp.]
MLVVFQDDGSLVVKTNGEEKKYPYRQKAGLQGHFSSLLYTVIARDFEKTPRYQELELRRKHTSEQNAAKQLEKNRRSWE